MKKLVFFLLLLPSLCFCGVNLKNGNFYINYTDIIVPGGGNDLSVVRTYNSKSTERGWFGFGWGSDFETSLIVGADGSVVVHENGSGAKTRFTPKKPIDPELAATKIIGAMRKRNSIPDNVANRLKNKLKGDAELRIAYAKKFNVKSDISSGTTLYSSLRGKQRVVKAGKNFKRIFDSGKYEQFNKNGRLTEVKDKYGYKIKLNYKDDKLISIKDSQAKQLFFEWYSNGKVKSVSSGSKIKSKYKYDGEDLIESEDVAGNTYKFSYDNNHNLLGVTYKDGRKMEVSYTAKTQFVSSIKDKKGIETKYKYESNKENPNLHYWTVVSKKDSAGNEYDNKYEYELKIRPDGSQYTYRILTIINEFKSETTYSECCGLPLKIVKGKGVTNFEYNKRGLLTKKTTNKGEYINLEYHKKINKIVKVVNNDGWTKFSYDKKGNLNKATNNKGKAVLLVYDLKGRIMKMVDYDKKKDRKRSLSFKYNALGKPTEIDMKKVGKINVSYDNFGEIKRVTSKSGKKMAMQVTEAFQSLLTIVRPAGVNLNM